MISKKRNILAILILLIALLVSGSAAYYSITGLSKIFQGAKTEVIVMTTALEVAKIFVIIILHGYWDRLNKALKYYLISVAVVLMLITSVGVYGFLSNAYQKSKIASIQYNSNNDIYQSKKKLFEDKLKNQEKVINVINSNIQNYTTSGEISKVNQQIKLKEEANILQSSYIDSINVYEINSLKTLNELNTKTELGPLQFISKLINSSPDSVVNWFIVLIIFVFDPLGIVLVISSLFVLNQIVEKNPEQVVKVKRKYVRKPKPVEIPAEIVPKRKKRSKKPTDEIRIISNGELK